MKRLLLVCAVLSFATSAFARDMITAQEALQPYGQYWYTQVTVQPGDSTTVAFPTNYDGVNFRDADGVTVHLGDDCTVLLFSDMKGTYKEHQYFDRGTWWTWAAVDADSACLRAAATAEGPFTVELWVWRQ
ncbi:MAG: hypothetical protein A2W26_04265 [Acidobacteria bacterium RBG_16_64_8]|nr:MAG: hypothetical protein A2W26_04265 [Acidobacteria bacterium RBG_16_64_8]